MLPLDPAIDRQRIDAEAKAIAEKLAAVPDDQRERLTKAWRHPWARYAAGEGRFDLGARYFLATTGADAAPRDYLHEPTEFHLAALSREIREEVLAGLTSQKAKLLAGLGLPAADILMAGEYDASRYRSALALAARHGVARIERWPTDHRFSHPLTDADLDHIHDVCGAVIDQIADAVLSYSSPLRPDEGLPSASPGTEPGR